MLAEYFREKDGCETIEMEKSFAAFNVAGDQFYIAEMYVAPEGRATGAKRALYEKMIQVAKERGCKYAACHLPLNSISLNQRLNTFYTGGFRLNGRVEDNRLVMILPLDKAVLPEERH